ncbi:ornithine cyclodeaminase family protein [Achromobacter deleyi]|uniref:ornithine cyclodeaminase family protein n=1 Tax=Achromobacter deleyi TaxID=1353891 RepID=UPI0014695818|nr:ornithine cyclodeaminase family protein [Achromobacter deleyi]CAB3837964.1 Alanine dehydrogenase [Achromobacter deleyi]
MSPPLWISESQVTQLLSLEQAIPALERGLRLQAEAAAANMAKTMLQFDRNNLHALGARVGDYVGTKTWAHTQGGTCPLLLLWHAADGQLAAVIEAFALGNLRTGGTSGVATDWLARPDARVMALAGTGKQSLSQVAAVLAVREINEVRVYSPTPASRDAFAERISQEFASRGVRARSCATMARAAEGADVITLVTRADEPFLDAAMLAPGAHLNAVGAIAPDREEFTQDVFDRAAVVAVDDLTSVKNLSREFRSRYGDAQQAGWSGVTRLADLVLAGRRRNAGCDLTLFKAMGMGISDVALGIDVLARARQAGLGQPLAVPVKSKPRFFGAADAPSSASSGVRA